MIVGGGISGLYCAMKLIQLKEKEPNNYRNLKSISILEKSNRWGGRIDTDIIKIDDNTVKEEEGAMRFTYNKDYKKSNMPHLGKLIQDLDLEEELTRFYMTPQANPPSQLKHVYNINGRYYNGFYFTEWDAEQNPGIWRQVYNLHANDITDPEKIFQYVYIRLLQHNASKIINRYEQKISDVILNQAPRELLREYENADYWSFARNEFTWPVQGKEILLNQFSMMALMREMEISNQACKLIMHTQRFVKSLYGNAGCILQEFKIFDILWDDFYQFKGEDTTSVKQGGYFNLVQRIMNILNEAKSRNQVDLEMRRNCEVFSLRKSGKKSNSLGFEIDVRDTNESQTIDTQHVILAVTPKAVEDILLHSEYCEFENTDVMKICESTRGFHLTKINLYFKDDWWNENKYHRDIIMYGGSRTDLQIGSVYPFYAGLDDFKSHPCPAALTIYCDMDDAEFWNTVQRLGDKFHSALQQKHHELQPVSEALLEEAIKQLKKLFDTKEIPEVLLTSYRSWDGRDFQYAFHLWGLGVDDRDIMKKAAEPIENKNLYLCNEAWSGYQGWVEGALMSTENVLQRLQAQLKVQHESEE